MSITEKKIQARVKFLLNFLKPYRTRIYVVMGLLFIEVVLFSLFPFTFKFLIDNALFSDHGYILMWILIGLMVIGISEVVVGTYEDYLYGNLLAKLLEDMRYQLFVKAQFLPMDYFGRVSAGDTLTHFSNDLNTIEEAISGFTFNVIYPILFLLFNLILLIILSWQLTVVAVFACFLITIGPKYVAPHVLKENDQRKQSEAELLSLVHENIMLQTIIRAFGLFEHAKETFSKFNQHISKRIARAYFLSLFLVRSTDLIMLLLRIILLSIGAFMVYRKLMTVGDLVSFFLIFTAILSHINIIAHYYPTFIKSTTGMSRLTTFLKETESITDVKNPLTAKLEDHIEFEDVTYSTNDFHILKNINLNIPKYTSVAIVGLSGSGKTTISRLLMRFIDPSSGGVKLDNVDIRNVSQQSLHQLISYVPQEPLLFNTSIAENIRLGKLDATQAEIEAAAKKAEIHEVIMRMPEGYNTIISQRGDALSIGQRQRIAIARAIVRASPILILDEPTSSLDPITEAEVIRSLIKLTQTVTSIIVTHRLETITSSDLICVVQDGMICEQGSHYELLSMNGTYKKLWDIQHGFIFNEQRDEAIPTAERLHLIPAFRDVPLDFLRKVSTQFITIKCEKDVDIIKEGDPGDKFYVIIRGIVGIYKRDPVSGQSIKIGLLDDGQYFGEIALVKSIPRVATVRTLVPTLCIVLQRSHFLELVTQFPEVGREIEQSIDERLAR